MDKSFKKKSGFFKTTGFQTVLLSVIFFGLCLSSGLSATVKEYRYYTCQAPVNKTDSLHWKIFTVTRPGLTRDPAMPGVNDSLKKVTNTSTLIYGKKDAVLIDVFLTIDQSKALADSVAATGKCLKYIYITHPHGDHFFGLQPLLDRFPNAKAIATQAVVEGCVASMQPDLVSKFWAPKFPGQIPSKLTVPMPIKGTEFYLEGQKLVIVKAGFTDTHNSTSIYIPSIGLIVAGDVVYNGIHTYLVETSPKTRQEWLDALDVLMAMHPKAVIAGHKKPGNDDSPDNMAATKKYIEDFERCNKETATGLELYNKMILLYPERGNPGALWGSALAAKKSN